MPLTHVCMWSEHGWIRITADEAARLHPGGTVSARSGLFRCNLCGQYVMLTAEYKNARHFRHTSDELSKDCPDHSAPVKTLTTFQAGVSSLPLRLRIQTTKSFDLQLGFIRLPEPILKSISHEKIAIRSTANPAIKCEYLVSRIQDEGITYLSLGDIPASQYSIILSTENAEVRWFWPELVNGVSNQGALFDGVSGKMLPDDADVLCNHPYYLLTPYLIRLDQGVSLQKICENDRIPHWRVYKVVASTIDEASIRFFLDYRCRLSDGVVTLIPVWPQCIKTPYVFHHYENDMYFLLLGNATAAVFPLTNMSQHKGENCQILQLDAHERQQILSAGRTKVLRYTYLLKDSLDQVTDLPDITITDIYGNRIEPGEQESMPTEKTICIRSEFDGIVCVRLRGAEIERMSLKANTLIEVTIPSWGTEIFVTQGFDCVWEASFTRKPKQRLVDDEDLYEQLIRCNGSMIPISHSIGAIVKKLGNYPNVKKWLSKSIHNGEMSASAYKLLLKKTGSRK